MFFGSFDRSNASAASICMRKASSNDWMRASSPASSRRDSWCRRFSSISRSSWSRCSFVVPESFRMFSISRGSSVCWLSMKVPWYAPGRKADCQFCDSWIG
jgi:hypothetical protein